MFGGVDFIRKGFEGIGHLAVDAGLAEMGTTIDLSIDPVDGAAGLGDACIPSLADAIQSRKGRKEAWVQVDDPASESVEQRGFDHAHEAREDDEVDLSGLEVVSPYLFPLGRKLRLKRTGIQKPRRDAILGPQLQHLAGRDVAPQAHHFGLAEATFGLGAEDGIGIGAATGAEEGDAHETDRVGPDLFCKRNFERQRAWAKLNFVL